jgi:hypothetical protein
MVPTSKSSQRQTSIALKVFVAFGAAAATSTVLGYIALATMPCSWFGSPFEGACGLGAMIVVVAAGALLTVLLTFTGTLLHIKLESSQSSAGKAAWLSSPESALRWWRISFWLLQASYIVATFSPAPWNSPVLALTLLAMHCGLVFLVAKQIGKPPLLWAPLALILAPVGTIGTYWYFRQILKPTVARPESLD